MRTLYSFMLFALVGAIAVVLVLAARQPEEFRISRTIVVDAPPAAVFTQVNNFHNWEKWSPWLELDRNAVVKYEGPASGEGAKFHWAGNAEVGEGGMTIVRSRPDTLIDVGLQFLKPFENKADVQFTFLPVDGKTQVEWAMTGKSDFLGRIMCTVMNMERMVGEKYAEGLSNLKRVVEGGGNTAPAPAGTAAASATGTAGGR